MTKFFKTVGLCVSGLVSSVTAMAGETSNSFPIGLQLGVGVSATSGLNGFVGYVNKNFDSFWWKRLGVRFDFASTKPVRSQIKSLIKKYAGDEEIEVNDNITVLNPALKAKHVAAMVDIYPFGNTWFLGGWRLTGGYYVGDLQVSAGMHATGDLEFELGDKRFRYTDGEMHGKANAAWKYSGPYAGTGFDLGLFYGIKIFVDAGVVFTSKTAELKLDVPMENMEEWYGSYWDDVTPSDFEAAKEQEIADAKKEIDKIKFFPIVKIGFLYRF